MGRPPLARPSLIQPADPSYRLIALTRGQIAIVDSEDYDELMRFPWMAHWNPKKGTYYAMRNEVGSEGNGLIYMHRFVMKATKCQQVDHRHHQTLDNRKTTIAPCHLPAEYVEQPRQAEQCVWDQRGLLLPIKGRQALERANYGEWKNEGAVFLNCRSRQ